MRWVDRRGRPLPLDPIFAAFQLRSQRRAGLALARIMQQRQRRVAEDLHVLISRTSTGTRVFHAEPPI